MSVGFIDSSYPQRLRHFCSAVSSARIGVPPLSVSPVRRSRGRILVEWDADFHRLGLFVASFCRCRIVHGAAGQCKSCIATRGLRSTTVGETMSPDLVLVPSGTTTPGQMVDDEVLDWLRKVH